MVTNSNWQQISKQIEQTINRPFSMTNTQVITGGCINSSYLLQSNKQSYFVKLNQAHLGKMFEAEFSGLLEIAQTNTITVPHPILYGVVEGISFLVLEFTALSATNPQSDIQLGQQLAALHKIQQPFFGWHQDNTIGSTKQLNGSTNQWLDFWKNKRLDFQLTLAEKNGYTDQLIQSGKKLSESLVHFFHDSHPLPSLLHGDLWSGNTATNKQGKPIIYDPACYYGDRETDIAMTELFGGFSPNFYAAYHESFPLSSAYSTRKKLYNLYHILNHLNLFGTGYQQQAQNMIDSLLSEIA